MTSRPFAVKKSPKAKEPAEEIACKRLPSTTLCGLLFKNLLSSQITKIQPPTMSIESFEDLECYKAARACRIEALKFSKTLPAEEKIPTERPDHPVLTFRYGQHRRRFLVAIITKKICSFPDKPADRSTKPLNIFTRHSMRITSLKNYTTSVRRRFVLLSGSSTDKYATLATAPLRLEVVSWS